MRATTCCTGSMRRMIPPPSGSAWALRARSFIWMRISSSASSSES
jgi:hypothetical protein